MNTTALTYLPHAVNHGARIFSGCCVGHIEKSDEGGWRVYVTATDLTQRKRQPRKRGITAPLWILAAGVIGSTEILLRLRERGLAVSDALGKRFAANGDDLALLASLSDPILAVAIGHPPRAAPDIAPPGPNRAGQIALADAGDGEPFMIQDGTMSAMMPHRRRSTR
jgi:cholesterol oxidase